MKSLFEKYDVPIPRYTSYPTVPYWENAPSEEQWLGSLGRTLENPDSSLSLYLHIPFCETLCTFCGCNTSITRDHLKEFPYVQNILREWSYYRERVQNLRSSKLKNLHLGGGTPTFLSADHLTMLLEPILSSSGWDQANSQGSIEVDPRRTNFQQLQALQNLGFRRISLGVQDFNEEVQALVNRVQPFEITKRVTDEARSLGYSSVNFDLIYGLPKQKLASFAHTIEQTIKLKPDRIALYSFALVPWIKPAQRLFSEEDLPKGQEKRALYELAREYLLSAGYSEIGMDHFALKNDPLELALRNGKLHRNFMGYTEHRTDILLGLGVSSISESPDFFHQNEKVLPLWENRIQNAILPTHRGHILTIEDRAQREKILQFITLNKTQLTDMETADAKEFLHEMLQDDLVRLDGNTLFLTQTGRPFLRNACAFFDKRLRQKQPQTKVFSQAL